MLKQKNLYCERSFSFKLFNRLCQTIPFSVLCDESNKGDKAFCYCYMLRVGQHSRLVNYLNSGNACIQYGFLLLVAV